VSCGTLIEADVIRSQLDAAGITAMIPDEFLAEAMAFNLNAVGYVRVQVSPKDYEAAKDVIEDAERLTGMSSSPPAPDPDSAL
jgi:Putative prokaryotic signal transducing protein